MQRLINSPTYKINNIPDNKYRATVMMLMDCESHPFSKLTRLTSLKDLYSNYATLGYSDSYNIARNLLSTGKLNIVGINQSSSENNRSTIALYEHNDDIVEIYPSYSTVNDNSIDDGLKWYRITFDNNTLYDNMYFKIYQTNRSNYLFALINSDLLNDYDKHLLEIKSYRNLIERIFNISPDRYFNPIVVETNSTMSAIDVKHKINNALLDKDITYESFLEEDYYIKIGSEYINEPLLTNCDYKFEYNTLKEMIKTEYSIFDYSRRWYSYILHIIDRSKHFYFKTYYTKQNSILFCVVNVDSLSDVEKELVHSNIAGKVNLVNRLFGIDRNYYTKVEIVEISDNLNETDYKKVISDKLKSCGLLYEWDNFDLTIYTNKLKDPLMTNLYLDINYRKSYDIDYYSNYNKLKLSAWSIQSNITGNLKFTITNFGDIYTIQIYNLLGTDVVDAENYSSDDIELLESVINNNSNYINVKFYKYDELPTGTFTLQTFNVNHIISDPDYINTIDNIDLDTIINYNVDIIYNTRNSIDFISSFNNLITRCDNRLLLISDEIESLQDVNRFDLQDFDISYEISENLEDNRYLKDDKKYKHLYLIFDNCIFKYNNSKVPSKYNDHDILTMESNVPLTFGEIINEFTKKYCDLRKKQFVDCIENNILTYPIGSYIDSDTQIKVDRLFSDVIVEFDKDTMKLIDNVGRIFKLTSYKDLDVLFDLYDINKNIFEFKIPNWDSNIVIVPTIKIQKYCAEDGINNKFNNICLNKRIDSTMDTSYYLLYSIFTSGKFDLELTENLSINEIDNEDQFINDLKMLYGSTIRNNCINLNTWHDNDYYYSLLNPLSTYNKYSITLQEHLSAILKLNRVLHNINKYTTDIEDESDCAYVVEMSNSEVDEILNISVSNIQLTNFIKNNNSLTVYFRIEFYNNTKSSYDFNITINI